MLCGRSFNNGILIYDHKDQYAVFAYYHQDEICFIEGPLKEVEVKVKSKSKNKNLRHLIIFSFLFVVLSVLYSLFHLSLMFTLSLILFYITSYIKLCIIIYSFMDKDEQFKRFHACEHKLLNVKGEVTLEKIKDASYFHQDCGTIIACNVVFFMAVVCLSLAYIFNIGILAFIRSIILVLIFLFINIFNPYNPFFLIQRQVVSHPGDYELNLALKLYEKYKEVVQ